MSDVNRSPSGIALNAKSLWAGGVAASVVAALVAVVGILVCRGLLDVQVLAPKGNGVWGDASTGVYALSAFVAGLLATGIVQVLYMYTPSPRAFFAWIIGLLTILAAVIPFIATAKRSDRIATAVINLLIGLAIYSLVSSSAERSRTAPAGGPPAYPPPPPGYPPTYR